MHQDHQMWDELERLEQECKEPLARILVRQPSLEDTRSLIQDLQVHFDALRQEKQVSNQEHSVIAIPKPSLLHLFSWQIQIYNKWFWLVSACIFILITLAGQVENFSDVSKPWFSAVYPLFFLCGFLYSARHMNRGMRMIEMITPYPPALLLLSRTLLILLMTIGYGVLSSIYLELVKEATFSLFVFLLDWLAPLILLSGLLLVFLFYKGWKVAVMTTIVVWVIIDWLSRFLPQAYQLYLFQGCLLGIGMILLWLAYRLSLRQRILQL